MTAANDIPCALFLAEIDEVNGCWISGWDRSIHSNDRFGVDA